MQVVEVEEEGNIFLGGGDVAFFVGGGGATFFAGRDGAGDLLGDVGWEGCGLLLCCACPRAACAAATCKEGPSCDWFLV